MSALRPNISKLAAEFSQSYEGPILGMAPTPSEQFARYRRLETIATTSELELLARSSNPAMRVYAVAALAERKAASLPQVVLEHLDDDQAISRSTGDVTLEDTVVELILELTWTHLDAADRHSITAALIRSKPMQQAWPEERRERVPRTLAIALADYAPDDDDIPILQQLRAKGAKIAELPLARVTRPSND